jgi:hypothetical protein
MRTPQIVLFLVLLNSAAFAVGQIAPVDVTPTAGGDAEINEARDEVKESEPGSTEGQGVLIGGFNAAMGAIDGIRTIVFYGPEMLITLGAPALLIGIFEASLAFVVGYDVLQAFTGRQFS